MALILPKGIVVNSPQIGGDIERIDAEPLDEADIAKVWKVYTTTQRRLLDPTAERLENLWWRIWGSPKKRLKGATVARLFAQISHGQTFVPLRGPSNRHEGRPPLTTSSRHGPGASSTNNLRQQTHSRPSTTSSSVASRPPASMPHPILKKTRGPSSTGPRPTARFISPHESQDEGDQTSSASPNTHVTVQPPSPSPEPQEPKTDKKATVVQTKKNFVASKKKRPVIVRRQSSQTSQSSADAAAAAKASESGQSSANPSSSDRTPPAITEQARGKAQSKFQENFTPSLQSSSGSKQTLKKQSSRSTESTLQPQRRSGSTSTDPQSERDLSGDPGSSKQLRRIENLQEHVNELSAEELEELELQRMLLEEANARVRKQSQATQMTALPSLSESANEGLRIIHNSLRSGPSASRSTAGLGAMGLLQHDSKAATTSATPTFTDASGQVNLGSVGNHQGLASDATTSKRIDKGKGRDPEEMQRAAMFAKRPVQSAQVAASPDTGGLLSRSKSQLTLLLEKDRERGGGHKPDKDQSPGKKKK